MNEILSVLNELLVDTFNDILYIEQNAFQETEFRDLSITEIHTVDAIGMYKPRSMSEVAYELGITIGTLSTAINNLVKKGYVERRRIEEDRRIVQIQLTTRGKLAYRLHEKFHEHMVKRTIEGLMPEEEQILIKSLKKLNDFFKSTYKLKKE